MAMRVLSDMMTKALTNVINEWHDQGLSENEISNRLNGDKLTSATRSWLTGVSSDIREYFLEHMNEVVSQDDRETADFLQIHHKKWGSCFSLSMVMYKIAIEIGEMYSEYVAKEISEETGSDKEYSFRTLQYMQGRCCQIYKEILCLIKNGFADGAFARWRSMYELACNAGFILKHGETIAKSFFEQSKTNDHRYSWSKEIVDKRGNPIKTFQQIQENCGLNERWKSEYKISCFITHGSPQGTFKRLGLKNNENKIVVGHSVYGVQAAAINAAITLHWMTGMFISLFPCLDAIAYVDTMGLWVDDIVKAYSTIESN